MRIPSGVTDQYIYFVAIDDADFTTRKTGFGGSGWTVYRSRNGGTATAFTTPTINETSTSNMPGVYELLLDEDMTIDSGDHEQEVCLHITHTGMVGVTRVYTIFRPDVTAGQTLTVSSGNGNAAVQSIANNAITAASVASDAVTEIQSGLATASALSVVDSIVDDILVDTGTTLPSTLSSIDGKIDTIDTVVDSIQVDTNSIETKVDTIDGIVDSILVDTGTTLDTKIDGIKTKTDSLTFTEAGVVDANIQYVNDVEVTGDGEEGTEWGPV